MKSIEKSGKLMEIFFLEKSMRLFLMLILLPILSGCGKDDDDSEAPSAVPDKGEMTEAMVKDEAQTPPLGATALQTWLDKKLYNNWACETAAHAARSPSAHSVNRICSNSLLSTQASGDFSVGSATVKELFSGETVTGYAVMLKTKTGGADGWYFYEKLGSSVVADGMGSNAKVKSSCVGCHSLAGSSSAHSGRDFIFTQVVK